MASKKKTLSINLVAEPGQKLPKELRNIKISWQFLNNEYGRKLLEKNEGNRNISEASVRKYNSDMKDGKWWTNGDALRIDNTGNLMDGQQRATSAARLEDPAVGHWTLQAAGLDPKVRPTIDVGRPRSFADELKFEGEENTTVLAAVIKRAYAWEAIGERWDVFRVAPSHQAMMEYFRGDEEYGLPDNRELLRWAAGEAAAAQSQIIGKMAQSTFGFLLYLTTMYGDKEKARQFWVDGVRELDGIPKKHPAHRLRKRLGEITDSDLTGRNRRLDQPETLAYCIQAWNEFWTGEWESATTISRPRGGWSRENMPILLPKDNRGYPDGPNAKPKDGWSPNREFIVGDEEGWD